MAACCSALACTEDPPATEETETPGSSEPGSTAPGTSGGSVEPTNTSSATETEVTEGTGGPGATSETDSTAATPDMPGLEHDPNEDIPPVDAEGCHAIYAQDLLPTFEVTVEPDVWAQLMDEWNNGQANEDAGVNTNPYHPLAEFKYGDIRIHNASIRLRGNPTWWNPVPGGDKMQFQIGFDAQTKKGHFLGLKRVALDAATYNRHMLRDRLSLRFMRSVGIAAPCANNARLVVNGEYYGIFSNLEKLDEKFLERVMDDPSGGLWERNNWQLQANKDNADESRLEQLQDANTLEEVEEILDIEQALLTYAAEAVLPDSDGAWAGGKNFYVYDDPSRGKFMLLPWDLDNTLERFEDPPEGPYPVNPDPFVWEKLTSHGRTWYDISLKDPAYFDLYIDIIDQILHEGYQPAKMLGWVDEMSAQIEEAVLTDTNKPYTNTTYHNKVKALREYIQVRYDFVDDWLVCWQSGGKDDGLGYCVEQ
ncbi:CotH kinase family protein [Nannocystis punicea]|uniref:CotH kinase family protein n=1 Tax=Nannocystis punicea TaxID=2995304 RepID=A0ABY7H3H2_9BACT|nr:CotH kinase family protein [Nannocystis poenicansa]WAS93662.1 CotH kinase family protein [Nannocystis poenicansa]